MNHPSTVAVSIDLSGWLRALDCCPGDLTLLGYPGRATFSRSCSQHSLQHSLCCRSAAYEKIPAMRIETQCSWIGYKTIHRRFRSVLNSFENLRYRSELPPMPLPRPVFSVSNARVFAQFLPFPLLPCHTHRCRSSAHRIAERLLFNISARNNGMVRCGLFWRYARTFNAAY